MAIKDIKLMNGEGYLFKDLSLSLSQYEEQMSKIDYDGFYDKYRTCRDESGVENTQFPSIIFSFYNTIFIQSRIPLPEELLDEYYRLNANELFVDNGQVIYQNKSYKKMDLDAWILRTYPSLVRDHHFFLMLLNENCFDKVIYSCKNDIAGKDIVIQHQGNEYMLSLFIQTTRSTFFKRIKNALRHVYSSKEIQLPLDLSVANKRGDFFVYSSKDLENVKSIILKKR